MAVQQTNEDVAIDGLVDMAVEKMKELLQARNLPIMGSKPVLCERLRDALSEPSTNASCENNENNERECEKEKDSSQSQRTTDIDKLTVNALKERLRELNLSACGKKAVLCEKLKAAVEDTDEEDSQDNDDENKDDNDVTDGRDLRNTDRALFTMESDAPVATGRHMSRCMNADVNIRLHMPTLTFKDVEDALETFSGDGSKNIKKWLIQFEETVELRD